MATPQTALVPTVLPGPASGPASSLQERLRRMNNQQTAAGDRQAVFRNDCAACHVEPTVGKMGGELFDKACGICHTAENRASMVPVLANIPSKEYWMHWITQGKEGSLMPVFSKSAGGPLTDEQITSLVEYLVSEGTPPAKPVIHEPRVLRLEPVRSQPLPLETGTPATVPPRPNAIPTQPESAQHTR